MGDRGARARSARACPSATSCARASPSPSACRTCAWAAPREQHGRIAELVHTGTRAALPRSFRRPGLAGAAGDGGDRGGRRALQHAGGPRGRRARRRRRHRRPASSRSSTRRCSAPAASVWRPETIARGAPRPHRRLRRSDVRQAREPRPRHRHRRRRRPRLPRLRPHRLGRRPSATTAPAARSPGRIPATGLSFAYCTNGFDRDIIRQGRRGVALSSLAGDLLA